MKPLRSLALLLIVALGAISGAAATPTATDLLRQAVENLRKASAIEATVGAAASGHSTTGKLLLSGNRFHLSTPQLITWFDGKTQWTYSPETQEVNISEPSAAELAQINPFAILADLTANYKPRLLKADSPSRRAIELTPKAKKAPYKKVVLTLDAATLYPSNIKVTTPDGATTTLTLSGVRTVKAPAATAFRFPSASYPKAEVIDLR